MGFLRGCVKRMWKSIDSFKGRAICEGLKCFETTKSMKYWDVIDGCYALSTLRWIIQSSHFYFICKSILVKKNHFYSLSPEFCIPLHLSMKLLFLEWIICWQLVQRSQKASAVIYLQWSQEETIQSVIGPIACLIGFRQLQKFLETPVLLKGI